MLHPLHILCSERVSDHAICLTFQQNKFEELTTKEKDARARREQLEKRLSAAEVMASERLARQLALSRDRTWPANA